MSFLEYSDWARYFAGRARYHLKWRWRYAGGFSELPDRKIFEGDIVPYFTGKAEVRRVLDVGCEWYNLHHARLFRGVEYHTIDVNPAHAKFGARRHVTGSFLDAAAFFPRHHFDLVLLNGVFGWGVNGADEVVVAVEVIEHILRPGGYVVVGWNDTDANRPGAIPSEVFGEGFSQVVLPELGWSHLADRESRHIFEFYRRQARVTVSCPVEFPRKTV